jgi:PleD family two-component response regulator
VTTAKLASTVLRDTEMIARFDNNSLAALFPSTALDQLVYPLERLGHGAATYVDPKYAKLDYAVSIGAVEVMLGEHPGSALQRLDGTLQKAKADGGGRICIHDGQSTLTLLETKAPSAASGQTAEPAKE